MPTLGLLNSLGGMNGIITTIVQPLGGWLADRLGRRPFLIAASLATIGGYALFAMAGVLYLWVPLMLGVVFLGVSALSNPARNSMTAESVRSDRHGSAFSLILVASMVPGIVAPTLGGWVVDHLGYIDFFPIAIALEAVGLLLIWRYVHETRVSNGEKISLSQVARVLGRSIVPPKGMYGFFLAVLFLLLYLFARILPRLFPRSNSPA